MAFGAVQESQPSKFTITIVELAFFFFFFAHRALRRTSGDSEYKSSAYTISFVGTEKNSDCRHSE